MIIAIHGLHCSGKTRLIKEIISTDRKSFLFKRVKSVKFMISKKFKLIILGHYPEEGVYIGADQIPKQSIKEVLDLIKKFSRNHADYSILFEGNLLNRPEIHGFIKRKRWPFKIFFLNASTEQLVFRENTLTEPFIAEKRASTVKSCAELIENSTPKVLNNDNEQDLTNNVKIILGLLNIRTKTKVK